MSGVLVLLPPTHSCPCTSPAFSFSLLIKNQCPFPLRPGKVDTQMETQQLPFTPRPGQNSDRVREVGAASSFSPSAPWKGIAVFSRPLRKRADHRCPEHAVPVRLARTQASRSLLPRLGNGDNPSSQGCLKIKGNPRVQFLLLQSLPGLLQLPLGSIKANLTNQLRIKCHRLASG